MTESEGIIDRAYIIRDTTTNIRKMRKSLKQFNSDELREAFEYMEHALSYVHKVEAMLEEKT